MSHIPNMLEKTLRYPGHADLIKSEFESKIIQPSNKKTLEKLFEEWKLNPGEKEFTVLDVHIKCESESHNYFLYDETDRPTSISSMARTTGYTATATVNYLLEGKYGKHGVFPPETISGETDIWMYINRYLSKRNVQIFNKTLNNKVF
jgi:saccharopine dehydrogenase-like NADP-dependent oxidoreductase